MALGLKLKKSAGVPVTGEVHGIIRAGNAARDAGEWALAADRYHAAVTADPALAHIWVQLGHMRKEAGDLAGAIDAYAAAQALHPQDDETGVHMADLGKRATSREAAGRAFVRAIRLGADHGALAGLREIVERLRPVDPAALHAAALAPDEPPPIDPAGRADAAALIALDRVIGVMERDAGGRSGDGQGVDATALAGARALIARLGADRGDPAGGAGTGIVFDVTDLIAHFRHHRLPTGIQRVQIEVVTRALVEPGLDVRVCCFIEGRDELLDIPGGLFMRLAAASTGAGGDEATEWANATARLVLHLALADPFPFRRGDRLVNLGTSWWVYNYFLFVRNAKRDHGITYIPFVHDFIPIVVPDYCDGGVVRDYVSWLVGVFEHADFYLANSRSTANDLIRTAARLGHRITPADVEVVPLDADFRRPAERRLDMTILSRWQLAADGYVLMVGTIEPRKNHILALEAWARLIAAHGVDAVPPLVIVGRSGWMNGAFFQRLNRDPRLRTRVTIIERVTDAELALLYGGCRFTIYPSHYEGWGLPVTESLCYGKVPVVAENSSLTEAGGAFALYFESDNPRALADALVRLLFEPGVRETMERHIADAFRPRRWSAIARQITRAVALRAGSATPVVDAPEATLGLYWPVTLEKSPRIWRGLGSGESFRIGTGWAWPEVTGSRTLPGGGELRIRVTPGRRLKLFILLRGLDSGPSAFRIEADGTVIAGGGLEAGQQRWVLANLPGTSPEIVRLTLTGAAEETVTMANGATPKQVRVSIAVAGFALVDREDETMRLDFIQSAGLGDLHDVNAFRERRSPESLPMPA